MDGFLEFLASARPWLLGLLSIIGYLLSFLTILIILKKRREPMSMLAWILTLLLLPFLGAALYYLLGEPRILRRTRRKLKRTAYITRVLSERSEDRGRIRGEAPVTFLDEQLRALAAASSKLCDAPVTAGNLVEVLDQPQEVYDAILRAIDSARDHIHLEYYIFRPDVTGRLFRDRLAARAAAGVEVRLLLDGIGCWGTRHSFLKPLIRAGGKVETFLPAVPLRRKWNINYRNHRKIVVVDGSVAFTGSQNIGDEYRGLWRRVAPWQDTHLRIEGPAAQDLQEIFIEDWYYAREEDLAQSRYIQPQPKRGDSLVQVVPSGPDQRESVLQDLLFHAISSAREKVRITSPYFVPDPPLLFVLRAAALRGIRVEVLVPSRTDNHLTLWAGRSYYRELLRAGVRVYENPEAMLHSKVVTIDDGWSLVGSANMDVRSFLLNFEVTASIFDASICHTLRQSFEAHCRDSVSMRLRDHERRPFVPAIVEGFARLCSPLL